MTIREEIREGLAKNKYNKSPWKGHCEIPWGKLPDDGWIKIAFRDYARDDFEYLHSKGLVIGRPLKKTDNGYEGVAMNFEH